MLCECRNDVYFGVPCHHQMAVALKVRNFPIELLRFEERWKFKYFKDQDQLKEPEILPMGPNNDVYQTFYL